MRATRTGLLIGGGTTLVLTACGTQVEHHNAAPPHAVVLSSGTTHTPSTVPASITPAATAATPVPTASAAHPLLATVSAASAAGSRQLTLISASGAVVAQTPINTSRPWLVTGAAGSAYWVDGAAVHQLTSAGVVRTIGEFPSDADSLVVAPNGGAYAYATQQQRSDNTIDNTIAVSAAGGTPQVIAHRVADPSHPTADAPQLWDYDLISWTSQGILFARVPFGGCGCAPFDMEMQFGHTALIDPATLTVTALPSLDSCPLSGLGPSRSTACFVASDAGATALRLQRLGSPAHELSMSGTNLAGEALFSPQGDGVAYLTTPSAGAGCGNTLAYTLHVLDTRSGAVREGAASTLALAGWASDGLIYGYESASAATTILAIDPTTLTSTTVWRGGAGAQVVGLA